MEANPSKFQLLVSPNCGPLSIDIGETTIKSEPHVKLLGVNLDSGMAFHHHITEMCKSVARQLNVLSRLKHALDSSILLSIYKTFILPYFNYCPVVWMHCTQSDSAKMENLQKRACRIILSDYKSDYHALRTRLNLPSLAQTRQRALVLETYRSLHNQGPGYINELTQWSARSKPDRLRANVPRRNTTKHGLKSFSYQGPTVFNTLPENIKSIPDVLHFKNQLKSWDGPACKCTVCV